MNTQRIKTVYSFKGGILNSVSLFKYRYKEESMCKKLFIILTAVLFFTACASQEQLAETTSAAETQNAEKAEQTFSAHITDSENLLNGAQITVLEDFALCYAKTLTYMQPSEISHLFADSSSEECHINKTAYKTLCKIRSMQDKDLSLEYAKVTYNIISAYESGNGVTVELAEDNVQKFKHLNDKSCTYNTYHIFKLVHTGDRWKIKSHTQEEDFFLLAAEAWNDAKGADCSERADNALQLLVDDAKENFVLAKENLNEFKKAEISKEYNRDEAVEYAKEWCSKRNSDYLEYDLYGGNCQNFASQCIHAGGMDMDIKGNHTCQWKFYGKNLNFNQSASGRSYSWIGVDEFYSYAVYNHTSGLAVQHDISLEYAQKGDIIQVGAYGQWRHSLVVTDVLKGENGEVEDVVLASNTADRWNYPLSAYIYTYPRLIHIDGQI